MSATGPWRAVLLFAALLVGSQTLGQGDASNQPGDDLPPAASDVMRMPTNTKRSGKPGRVTRAQLTSGLSSRQPVDDLTTVAADINKVYFFTELSDMQGEVVVHRWEHDGKVVTNASLQVADSPWQVWSTLNLLPEWAGAWKVSVITGGGKVLASETFQYEDQK